MTNILDMSQHGIYRDPPELPLPEVVRDTALAITFIPADPKVDLKTLTHDIAFNDMLEVQRLLKRGRIVIQMAGGLGEKRMLDLSTADAMMVFNLLYRVLPLVKP